MAKLYKLAGIAFGIIFLLLWFFCGSQYFFFFFISFGALCNVQGFNPLHTYYHTITPVVWALCCSIVTMQSLHFFFMPSDSLYCFREAMTITLQMQCSMKV